jgi:hypothetical protein
MKFAAMALPICAVSIALAGTCGVAPVDLKPIPPPGYSDVARACVCDSLGQTCRWAWVGVKDSAANPRAITTTTIDPAIAGYNPMAVANANQKAAADIAEQQARTKLIEEQTRALRAENEKRNPPTRIPVKQTKLDASMRRARMNHEDFDSVIDSADFQMTPTVRKAVLKSQEPAEVAYWLAKHPEENRRISSLSSGSAKAEITKIQATISQ